MRRAWEASKKAPITASDLSWRVERVKLPLGAHVQREPWEKILADTTADERDRLNASTKHALLDRTDSGHEFEVTRISLGNGNGLHMPGELFGGYQVAAKQMKPDITVCMAAYGDCARYYIGTETACTQGGCEVRTSSSNTAPQVEKGLMDSMQRQLMDTMAPH